MEIHKLQHYSLVNKVVQELENHIGMSSQDLAEFIIELATQKSTHSVHDFKRKLQENGAEFPASFMENLYSIIHRMKPSSSSSQQQQTPSSSSSSAFIKTEPDDDGGGGGGEEHEKRKKFAALSIPDRPAMQLEKRSEEEVVRRLRSREEEEKSAQQRRRYSDDRGGRPSFDRDSDQRRGRGGYDDRGERRGGYNDDDDGRERYEGRRHDDSDERHYHRRHNDRDTHSSRYHRPTEEELERAKAPQVNEVYKARVNNMQKFGCFCQLEETRDGIRMRGKFEGLCHVSQLSNDRVSNVADVVRRGDTVFVKVLSVVGSRISLTMRGIDQQTGEDLQPRQQAQRSQFDEFAADGDYGLGSDGDRRPSAFRTAMHAPSRSISGVPIDPRDYRNSSNKSARKLTPYEIFEANQLRAAGVLAMAEHPAHEEEQNLVDLEEVEEDVDVELNENEPSFLRGQTTRGGIIHSPVRIMMNPEGSLARAIEEQGELARERRELREQQQSGLEGGPSRGMAAGSGGRHVSEWDDPVPDQLESSSEWRGTGDMHQMPEWKRHTSGMDGTFGKITDQTIAEQRESLPIFALKDELVKAVSENNILVVIGETGSGKTTQITQYLAESGYASLGVIGCTQPRRVAAVSVAKRVAEEFGCIVGQEVGYTIRFEDCTSPDTKIKYMTEGMLLREALMDANLSKYSVIMLDEAHERNLHTDVLFALLKNLSQKRKDFKLIVTSATLDAEKFSSYFFNCPIFTIPGRTHPVEILYTKEPESDYLDAALVTVMQIHLTEPAGDILLFLTGQEEIDSACQILYERMKALRDVPELIILPVYSALPSEMQSKIFEPTPPGKRKVVIATNIAETSITIDGIFFVVDTGFVKCNVYNAKTGMDQLMVVPISQAAARQRAGRAGRTGPGRCFRLYTEEAYKSEMLPNSVPEIQRTNMGNVVLMLKAMGINDLLGFDFMDPPPVQTLITAMEQLYSLGALDEEGLLTRLGRKMAEFPLEPQTSKTLIASVDFGCSDELLNIVSMLSVQSVFYRPKDKAALADQKKAKFHQPEGDHLTLLAVYQAWKNNNYSKAWCYENFIQARSLLRAQDVRKQLITIMDRYNLDVVSCGKNYTRIRKAITSGFFAHAAKKDPQEGYKTLVENQPVYMHPSSALFNHQPEWVVYHTLVVTTKEYMREVIAIEPKWLAELAPNFYTVAKQMSRRKQMEKIEPLYDKFRKPDEWRISKRRRMK